LKAPPKPESKPIAEAQGPAQAHQDLQKALTSQSPRKEIETWLSTVFLDTPDRGPVLTTSVQVANNSLSYQSKDGRNIAPVDVLGLASKDHRKQGGWSQRRRNITSMGHADSQSAASIYNNGLPRTPGLYQVRVPTRDINSGRVGSAQQWVEIPNLSLGKLQ